MSSVGRAGNPVISDSSTRAVKSLTYTSTLPNGKIVSFDFPWSLLEKLPHSAFSSGLSARPSSPIEMDEGSTMMDQDFVVSRKRGRDEGDGEGEPLSKRRLEQVQLSLSSLVLPTFPVAVSQRAQTPLTPYLGCQSETDQLTRLSFASTAVNSPNTKPTDDFKNTTDMEL